jgi:hypothetical protein
LVRPVGHIHETTAGQTPHPTFLGFHAHKTSCSSPRLAKKTLLYFRIKTLTRSSNHTLGGRGRVEGNPPVEEGDSLGILVRSQPPVFSFSALER